MKQVIAKLQVGSIVKEHCRHVNGQIVKLSKTKCQVKWPDHTITEHKITDLRVVVY